MVIMSRNDLQYTIALYLLHRLCNHYVLCSCGLDRTHHQLADVIPIRSCRICQTQHGPGLFAIVHISAAAD